MLGVSSIERCLEVASSEDDELVGGDMLRIHATERGSVVEACLCVGPCSDDAARCDDAHEMRGRGRVVETCVLVVEYACVVVSRTCRWRDWTDQRDLRSRGSRGSGVLQVTQPEAG